MRYRILAVVAVLFALSASAALAESRALLIGASGYPADLGPLHGPANDVQIVWALLAERGFEKANLRVLADNLPATFAATSSVDCGKGASDAPGCPMYANIVRALAELEAATGRGDYAVLYFSGHGVQIPDLTKRDEPDGLSEAFVPLDVGRWDAKRRAVQNLIADDVVSNAIEKMRAKGAFVWAIFDTCHSGDMTRGATSYAAQRLVRGHSLGIPDQAYVEAKKVNNASSKKVSSLDLLKSGRAHGLVGFYAAHPDQLALELAFEERDAAGKSAPLIMGAFTNALRRALAQEPNPTYRQLAQRMVEIYSNFGADMPAPYFEGDLDKAAFSARAVEPVWQSNWRAGKLDISAGELNGVSEGAILQVLDDSGTSLGYVRVERATANRSEAIPVAFGNRKPPAIDSGTRLRAKLERPGIRAVLRVALPPASDVTRSGGDRSGMAVIEMLRRAPTEKRVLALDWVDAGQPADLHLRLRDGRIWLLTAFGDWTVAGPRQTPSIATTDVETTSNALQENLWRAARSLNLLRVATSYRQSVGGLEGAVAKNLNADLFLYRDPRTSPGRFACPDAPASQSSVPHNAVRVAADALPEFKHCDIVYVVMRNNGSRPIDVTLLYIEAEAQINCFNGWGKARIDPGEKRDRIQAFRIVTMDQNSGTPAPIGRERLMIIGVEKASRDEIETTFCHLQQKSLDRAVAERNTRGGGSSSFAALMEDAGFATNTTRGFTAVRTEELDSVTMRTFAWDVKDSSRK